MTRVLSHDCFRSASRAERHRYLACPTRYTLQEEKLLLQTQIELEIHTYLTLASTAPKQT